MKLFWKIFTAVFISFVVMISFISYEVIVRQILDWESHFIEENRLVGSFISREIEKSYRESKWPFESLRKLSERKDFLYWWVVRDDGTIHLADSTSFMGTYAYEYFPQMANRGESENVSLNRNQNYGILVEPLKIGKNRWSFWFGFSLRDLLDMRKEIIFRVTIVSLLALGFLGLTLYFTIMHFTRPIKDLTVGAAIIGRGDLAHRVKTESKDELGELASSFNRMAQDLKKITVSKDYVNSIIDSMIDTLIVLGEDLKIRTINKATLKLLGYREEELIGRPVEILFAAGEEVLFTGTRLGKLIEEGKVSNCETHYRTKDGRKVPVLLSSSVMKNEDGKIICLVCTARDITERKKMEGVLRRSEERYRGIFEHAADSIVLVDADTGELVEFNDKAWENLGYTREEFKDLKITDLEAVESPEEVMTHIDKIVKEGSDAFETRHRTKGGEIRDIQVSSRAVSIAGRGFIQSIWRDITERKKAEEALIQSEKLRALGEMAGGVAHDFNNLLAIILGNAQLLEKGVERYKSEEIKERLKIIARTAYEGGETVRRLQYFTSNKLLTQDFTRIDLNEMVRFAITSTSPRWKDEAEAKGITIRIKEKLGKPPSILGSRSELMEVLTNLMFNSVESMREGGEITIRTEARQNEILLYFTDTGQGIPTGIKKKIFDPFFTTKGPKASGLGLSTCYGIIKRHKGKIKVESIKGKGTTFTISVPVPLEVPLKKEKLRKPEKISSRKILVIDDEEGVRDVLGRIFQDEGHRVVLAETPRKGLEEFKQDNFDLVLTDLGMPEMSGWELAKKMKEIDPSVPVGLITGWAVATPKEKMKEKGVDFVLSKPFDYAKVATEVNAVLKSKKR